MSEHKVKVKRIFFFDSGVGGLSIYRDVNKLNPDIEAYYFFDNEFFPYGNKSEEFIRDRCYRLISEANRRFDLSGIVVACNTASTIVLPTLRSHIGIPIVGVVPAIKPAAILSKNKILGLLATPGTISREYTKKLISKFAQDCSIIKVGKSELAEIAEERLTTGHVDKEAIKLILKPFMNEDKEKRPDTVILGCTHYPFIKDVIAEILPGVRLVDTGEAIGRRVKNVVGKGSYKEVEMKRNRAFYTGELKNYNDRLKMVQSFGFEKLEKFVI